MKKCPCELFFWVQYWLKKRSEKKLNRELSRKEIKAVLGELFHVPKNDCAREKVLKDLVELELVQEINSDRYLVL